MFGIGIPLTGALRPVSLDAAVGAVAGVAFASMFLLAVALSLCLVRVRQLRPSAVLLIAVLPALGLAIILQAIGSAFAHPAYAETAVYLGIALLGRRAEIDIAEPDLVADRHDAVRVLMLSSLRLPRMLPSPQRPLNWECATTLHACRKEVGITATTTNRPVRSRSNVSIFNEANLQ